MMAGADGMRMGRVLLLLVALAVSACALSPRSSDGQAAPSSADRDMPGGGIHIQWQVDLDQRRPASPFGFSIPLVIQAPSGARIIAGAEDRRVRMYDMDGNELGRIALLQACESGAAQLGNGLIVLGDIGGHLYGIDIDKGVIAWRKDLPSVLLSKPIPLDGGFVIQTADNRIYRFDDNGAKVWSYIGPAGGLSMRLTPSPLLDRGRLFAAFTNGDVVALRADSGALIWKKQLLLDHRAAVLSELKVVTASPLLIPSDQSGRDEDMLLVPIFQDRLVFLSALDGSRLMERKISSKATPLLLDRRLFVADGDGALSALDAGSGDTLWKKQLAHGELTGPVLYRGELWLADSDGKVYRVNRDGKVLADVQLPGRIDRDPVPTERGVLVRNSLGAMFLLN